MNLKQKITLLLGIIIIVLMGIYPPWGQYAASSETGRIKLRPLGYSFFTTPSGSERGADIDYTRLAFQWIMVAISTGGFLLMLKDKKKLQRGDDMPTDTQ